MKKVTIVIEGRSAYPPDIDQIEALITSHLKDLWKINGAQASNKLPPEVKSVRLQLEIGG